MRGSHLNLLKLAQRTSSKKWSPKERKLHLDAIRAIGHNSTEEEALIRLMVWTGAKLEHRSSHTREKDPLKILLSGEGWCDQQCIVFLYLAWTLLQLPGRRISLRHSDGVSGHTVCEVLTKEGWKLFDVDPMHCTVYRDPASGEILSLQGVIDHPELVTEEDHEWVSKNGEGKQEFYTPAFKPPQPGPVKYGESSSRQRRPSSSDR